MIKKIFLAISAVSLMACNSSQTSEENDTAVTDSSSSSPSESGQAKAFYGNYVSESYDKRGEGDDWVSVNIEPFSDHKARIKIRSRGDRKKPTCTFDDIAEIESDSTIISNNDGKQIVFKTTSDGLTIMARNDADNDALYFFCSGGGSIAGKYKKITEPLDSKVDKTIYTKFLAMQGQSFMVEAKDNKLTVTGLELTADKSPRVVMLDGKDVVDAEIADLDANGFPEVYIYTQSRDADKKMDLVAFAVNNGKSISDVYLAPIADDAEASKGYNGHDEFAVVENTLVRRFPVVKADGTHGYKQVQYKLKAGEATWLLVKDKVSEY